MSSAKDRFARRFSTNPAQAGIHELAKLLSDGEAEEEGRKRREALEGSAESTKVKATGAKVSTPRGPAWKGQKLESFEEEIERRLSLGKASPMFPSPAKHIPTDDEKEGSGQEPEQRSRKPSAVDHVSSEVEDMMADMEKELKSVLGASAEMIFKSTRKPPGKPYDRSLLARFPLDNAISGASYGEAEAKGKALTKTTTGRHNCE